MTFFKRFDKKPFTHQNILTKELKHFLKACLFKESSCERLKEFEDFSKCLAFGRAFFYPKKRSSMKNNFRMLIYLKTFFPSG
jgi:hypothetical protein